jgi:azurin
MIKFSYFLILKLCLFSFLYADESSPVKEIIITGNDAMQFDVKSFEAKGEESLRLTFKNIGSMPKIAMGHNLVILKKDISAITFGQKVLASGGSATNPLPKSLLGDVIASTKLLGPGESEVVIFKAPNETGEYEYVCTFPGHFAMMRGKMIVR